jgi:hypothetical protein
MSLNLLFKLVLLAYEIFKILKEDKNAEPQIDGIIERLRIEKQKSEPNYSAISLDLSRLFDKLN